MKHLLPLLIIINCHEIKGALEWTVVEKVTDYGQNVTLFCHVQNCCPKEAGWDRWTPVQRTLFIDVKTGRSNKKYDGKVDKDGYTLVIQNLTENDLNVSYSCLYGVTLGEQKILLEEDVFTYFSPGQPNVQNGKSIISKGHIAGIMVGVVVLTAVAVALFIFHHWKRKKKRKFKFQVENEVVPLIVKDSSHIECTEGEDAIFTYKSQTENLSVKLLKAGNMNIEHEHRDGQYIFILKDTKTVDSGEYNLQVRKFFRKKFHLQIKAYFLEDPTDIECTEGDEAIITCKVHLGSPSVKWFKNDNDLSRNDKYKIVNEGEQLKLLESKLDDNGEYCVQVGKSYRKVQLKIKAYFLKDPTGIECTEGDEAIMSCKVHPGSPSVKWLKNDTDLTKNDNYEISSEEGQHQLKLLQSKLGDNGEYCVQVGKSFRIAQLKIKAAYFLEDPIDIECTEGDEVIITCKVHPGSPPVRWFKNDNDLSGSDNYKISSKDAHHHLKLLESKLDDNGEYCVHVGKSFRKVQLKIKEIPNVIDEDERNIYMEAMKSGTEERQYVRIQVIGKDRVGKTSIVRRLLNETHDGISTDGLEINRNCQIRIIDGEWIVGEVASEKTKRIRRILQVVNVNQTRKESVSNQQHPFEENLSGISRESNGQKLIQSKHNLTDTKKNEPGPLKKKDTARLDVEPTNNAERNKTNIGVANNSTKKPTSNKVEVSEEKIKDTTVRDRKPGSPSMSQENNNQVNQEAAEKISDQQLIEKMNEILFRAQIEKNRQTSEAVVECGIWDFAGQKDYYATHQTFFTPNAIYLLVTDIDDIEADMRASKYDEEVNFDNIGDYIDFWLGSIHCFCKDTSADKLCPPVIMVCTGMDKVPADKVVKRKTDYDDKFLHHFREDPKVRHRRGYHFISNVNPSTEDIDKLKKHISDIAKEMNFFSENLPTKWIKLENALDVFKDLKKTICSWKTIETLAHNISISVQELNIFLKYQHKIGNIIFLEDKPDYIILQPNWLVRCFRCLVCDDNKKHCGSSLDAEMSNLKLEGQLSEKLIDELFNKEPNLHFREYKHHILDVMEKFDIIVKPKFTNTNEKVYYMPCMIKKSSALEVIIKENFNFKNPHRTPWLVLEFKFLPIAYFNHILFNYIRKYRVCTLQSGHPVIYTGKAIVHLDETDYNLLIICFSHNAISLQIYSAQHVINKEADDKTCAHILRKLCSKIEKLERSLMHKLSYNIKAKCSIGNYTILPGRISYSELQKEDKYFCKEHTDFHSTEDIENTWLKHTDAVFKWIEEKKKKHAEQNTTFQNNTDAPAEKTKLPTDLKGMADVLDPQRSKPDDMSTSIDTHGPESNSGQGFVSEAHLDLEKYPISSGIVVIVNNIEFGNNLNLGDRNGSDRDASSLFQTFQELGFDSDMLNDATKVDMEDKFNEIRNDKEGLENAGCLIVALLTHGNEDSVFMTDQSVKIKNVMDYFNADNCPELKMKPKIFIFQLSRGLGSGVNRTVVIRDPNQALAYEEYDEINGEVIPIPNEADFLAVYSFSPGYGSFRIREQGSSFVCYLTKELRKMKKEDEFYKVLTRVNNLGYKPIFTHSNIITQTPCFISHLTKELYLKQKD